MAAQKVPFWAPFDAVFDTSCPGNEGCAVVCYFHQHRTWGVIESPICTSSRHLGYNCRVWVSNMNAEGFARCERMDRKR